MSTSTAVVPTEYDEIVRLLLASGKSVPELLAQVEKVAAKSVDVKVPQNVPITKEQSEALDKIRTVYGKVAPKSVRTLTVGELTEVADERMTIGEALVFLLRRKDEEIRQMLHNHFDTRIDDAIENGDIDEDDIPAVDDHGHYLVKQEEPVPEKGMKFQRRVTDPDVAVSSPKLAEAAIKGHFTRAEYLSLTVEQPVKRVYDEAKAQKAIAKNPELLKKLSEHATIPPKKVASIWLVPDKG